MAHYIHVLIPEDPVEGRWDWTPDRPATVESRIFVPGARGRFLPALHALPSRPIPGPLTDDAGDFAVDDTGRPLVLVRAEDLRLALVAFAAECALTDYRPPGAAWDAALAYLAHIPERDVVPFTR